MPAYFTLSHCWGNIKILKLTRENIQDFQHCIPEDSLCKTFKDAVHITRMLGFQYLWIDSLCIIQNDVEDWRNEASKMSGVYGGSALNLAASAASDGRVGCFSSRNDAELQRTARYRIQCMKGSKVWTFNCIDPTLYASCIQNCPLNQRGWTFQERFLSPRTLHFTKVQLYWECRAQIACEMYQEALPQFIQNGNFGFMERSDAKGAWARAVNYSARKLTFEQDRLPAIAGAARWIHNQTIDEYVAGLWKRHLETQLLWQVYGDIFISRVVNIELSLKGHDPYGEVVSDRLETRTGPLVGVQTFVDVGPILLNQGKAEFKLRFDSKESGRASGFWYCLPIRRFCGVPTNSTLQGLILQAVPGTVNGRFRRAGIFVSYDAEPKFSIDAALEDPKCWADQSIYKGDAGFSRLLYQISGSQRQLESKPVQAYINFTVYNYYKLP
ncbi:heterokaryon incompatibility protein-domain-containing protein [Cadophora sp. MPI-SDFR-AT-0126]|nr:heterokaryon incompatibility protein-domain-containing protein [Leotiomycetes sp. MPI-SDFR-AT-0126]